MDVLRFTLSLDGVNAFRDALICLAKFSEDVSLEARRDSADDKCTLVPPSSFSQPSTAPNLPMPALDLRPRDSSLAITSKLVASFASASIAAYISESVSRYSLISLFRNRSSLDTQRDLDKQALIDRCEVTIVDGQNVQSRFVARIIFRNGLTSTHRLPFEHGIPIHARFNKDDAPHHWAMSSRTLRQLMDHFGPGVEYLDINMDDDRVNFTCFSEKTTTQDTVLKKPLHTSIAVEVDEFDDIQVQDELHVVIPVKDFRAIVQHAGFAGNLISARYSLPARPIQFTYAGDAMSCEFLVMTVGERGSNPNPKTTSNRNTSRRSTKTVPEAASSRSTGVATFDAPLAPVASNPTPHLGVARASASRMGAFDLRPSQRPPPRQTLQSESLFVDDDHWEPLPDQDQDGAQDGDHGMRLEWDHNLHHDCVTHMGHDTNSSVPDESDAVRDEASYIEPTQKLSDVRKMALFLD